VLAVRDNELDMGDDKVASLEVAEGETAREGQGKSRRWARGTTPVDGCRNGPRGGTGPDFRMLGIIGHSWILRV
jgi:hypothetical protein